MADYTTTRLLARVRKRAGLPAWGEDGLDDELLERINDELRLYLAAVIEGAKTQLKQTTLDLAIVANQVRYAIPARAIGAGVKMLEGLNASGQRVFLVEMPDREFHGFRTGDFYVEANEVVFFRAPTITTLRVTYSRRLSDLVATTAVRAITAINTGTKTVTIAAAPSTFTGVTALDLVKGTPHFDLYAMDAACAAVGSSATSIVFSSTLPTGLAVGDYVCLPGESPVVQAPLELHSLLAQQAAFSYLDDKGDERAGEAERRRNRLEADVLKLISERVQEGRLLINRNGPGFGIARGRMRSSGVLP